MSTIHNLRGGEFLVKDSMPENVFIPEEFNEEQMMLADAVSTFVKTEVVPHFDKIETQEDPELIPSLLDQAAELGMLGLAIPEEYGGSGIRFNTDMLMTEAMAYGGSFSVAFGVQTGIGMIPIVYYGTPDQKQQYLPKLVSGELKCCYCLTEPDAGSDANSGKTKAILNASGSHYMLSGQKMWITNGGFANLYIVFAKIDDDENLSAFIIEKGFGGIETGDEEKKMGIKGSSTVQLFFNEVPVPVDNLLGKRGDGFKIALNTLNIGRIKLGAGVVGGIKHNVDAGVEYAKNRKQFGKSLSEFGAIKHKIGEMMVRGFAVESSVYRAGQDIQLELDRLIEEGMDPVRAKMKSVEQYAVECAILKVYASEVAGYIADEGVQIFGGMGFSEDGPIACSYRDARILRIFEGTNEINRMLAVGMFFKKGLKTKEINMKSAVGKAFFGLMGQIIRFPAGGTFGEEIRCLRNLKHLFLLVSARASSLLKMKLADEQEVLLNLADITIAIYTAESALLRTQKLILKGEAKDKIKLMSNISRILTYEAVESSRKSAKDAILSFATGIDRKLLLFSVQKLTKTRHFNIKASRREVCDHVIALGKYPF